MVVIAVWYKWLIVCVCCCTAVQCFRVCFAVPAAGPYFCTKCKCRSLLSPDLSVGWLGSVSSFVRSEAECVKSNRGVFISPLSAVYDAQPSDGLLCFWGEGCSTSVCSFLIHWHGLLHRDLACDFSHSLTGIWGFSHIQASVYLSHSLCLFLSVWDVGMSVGIHESSSGFWHVQSAMFSARHVFATAHIQHKEQISK